MLNKSYKRQIEKPKKRRLLPEGHYRVKLVNTKEEESKTKRPMLRLTWRVVNGPYARQKIDSFVILDDDRALGVLWLIYAHLDRDYYVDDYEDMIGNQLFVYVIIADTPYGKMNNIIYYNPLTPGDEEIEDEEETESC